MATLTETAKAVRRLGLGLVILMLGYILSAALLGVLKAQWRAAHPPPAPGPEAKFGKLPPLHLSGIPLPTEPQPEFVLETITGTLPSFPKILKVYPLVLPQKTILAEDFALALARSLGFSGQPSRLTTIDYLWQKESGETLGMNIITRNFELKENWQNLNPEPGKLPGKEPLAESARAFISSKGLLGKTYKDSATAVILLRLENGIFKEAADPAQAEVARVDFFRFLIGEKEKTPLLSQSPKRGITRLYTDGKGGTAINYTDWTYDFGGGSDYPLREAAAAWEELKSGQGKVVYLSLMDKTGEGDFGPLPQLKTVTINEVFLAYFDDEQRQNFLQPIYVFSGEAAVLGGAKTDYIAYVPAIDLAWVVK